jgi:hypothetical protein
MTGARAAGMQFISFFVAEEMLELARECGLEHRHGHRRPVGVVALDGLELVTTSVGAQRPKIVCLPSRCEGVPSVMKNWLPFVSSANRF